jgi:hypothetical protein
LIDLQSVLTEESVAPFAHTHAFRMLPGDGSATNPGIRFRVETFAAADGFEPNKPYLTRLLWRDLEGNTQSKLLLTPPEAVLSIAVNGSKGAKTETKHETSGAAPSNSERRRTRRKLAAAEPT